MRSVGSIRDPLELGALVSDIGHVLLFTGADAGTLQRSHAIWRRNLRQNSRRVVPARSASSMRTAMAWLYLIVAGLFEMAWAIGLKYTEGFSRLVPSLLTVAAMIVSLALLGLALKTLPVGTAYAVWTGIGAVGTAALGIYLFGEPVTAARLASMGLIVAGIVGLKLVT